MGAKDAVDSPNFRMHDEGDEEGSRSSTVLKYRTKAREHMNQLQRLQEKDPEFFQFLKKHDKELLEFNAEDIDEDETNMHTAGLQEDDEANACDMEQLTGTPYIKEKPRKNVVTSTMVDSWIHSIREKGTVGAVGSLLRAFRTACHCGDDGIDESSAKFSIISSSVFNKIMMFVLSEMDGILRGLLKLPASGGKKETITDLMTTKLWKKFNHFVKSYIGNALHVLNQMTDTVMISFTLRRLRYSSIFLVAFPILLRKYIKVILHFWGTGGGALPVASFLFLRDICIRLGSDCTDECFKGIYKAYVLNCHFVNAVKLQHIQFLGNCVIELFGVDFPAAYQHAFVFIRQLAMILREALSMKTKEAFRKVYEWKFINCLELWTGAICAYSSESDIKPLAYPLTQVIVGVARSALKARYFPLRLRCIRMLNRIAAATGTFVPISILLLEMLEMKELNKPPSGGLGKAVDLRITLKVSKPTLKTRSFQEACVFCVIEELAEHFAQWSYSIAFFELSFITGVQLRSFCKSTKIERFRREMRELIRQIEANSKFTNERRMSISFLPNDPAVTLFLKDDKKSGSSPLLQYIATLHQKAQRRNNLFSESSVIVGAHSSVFGKKIAETEDNTSETEEAAAVFSSPWLPGGDSKAKLPKDEEKKKQQQKKKSKTHTEQEDAALYEDVVEDLVLSSDEDEFAGNAPFVVEDARGEAVLSKPQRKKRKSSTSSAQKNMQVDRKSRMAKRKRAN